MPDGQVLAMLDHIKDVAERTEKKLDAHIVRDEAINKDFVLPMWNSYQQAKGAKNLAVVLYTGIGGVIVAGIDFLMKSKQ